MAMVNAHYSQCDDFVSIFVIDILDEGVLAQRDELKVIVKKTDYYLITIMSLLFKRGITIEDNLIEYSKNDSQIIIHFEKILEESSLNFLLYPDKR